MNHEHIETLISNYLDGMIDESGIAELEGWIASNPASADVFAQWCLLHRQIIDVESEHRLHQLIDETLLNRPGLPKKVLESTRMVEPVEFRRAPLTYFRWLGWVAAAVILVGFFFYDRTTRPILGVAANQEEFVAEIIRKIDCDLESDRWAIMPTSKLAAGDGIELLRGLVEIEFSSGAIVTLEGPARFVAQSEMDGYLYEGSLRAKVPKQARGFTVQTATGKLVDLGTEFGLRINRDGLTETHVFAGEVELHTDGMAKKLLSESDAARIKNDPLGVEEFEAADASFLRLWRDDEDIEAEPLPVNRSLVLWLSADRHVQLDTYGRVASWGDILNEVNLEEDSAWQVDPGHRPDWAEDAFGDRPAIRFSGKSYMATTPFTTSDSTTIVLVFRFLPQVIDSGKSGQMINFNGPPNMVVERRSQGELMARLFGGWNAEERIKYGVTHLPLKETLVDYEPAVCAFVYDYENDTSTVLLNGKVAAQNTASFPAAIRSSKVIGRNWLGGRNEDYYRGDIAEMMIFNCALSQHEITRLSGHLGDKYDISITPAEE